MRVGMWLPWWLWLLAIPVLLAALIIWAAFSALFWVAAAIGDLARAVRRA